MASGQMPISEARRQLFSLFDRVVANGGDKIVIERRGHARRALLVSEEYVEKLEQNGNRTQRSKAGKYAPATGLIIGDPDSVLKGTRERQHKLQEAKVRRLWAALEK